MKKLKKLKKNNGFFKGLVLSFLKFYYTEGISKQLTVLIKR